MTKEDNKEKGIDEDMSLRELAFMINRSFNVVFDELRDIKQDISILKEDVAELKIDVSQLKTDVAQLKIDVAKIEIKVTRLETHAEHTNKRLDLMEKNMVNPFEFKALALRTDALEYALKA